MVVVNVLSLSRIRKSIDPIHWYFILQHVCDSNCYPHHIIEGNNQNRHMERRAHSHSVINKDIHHLILILKKWIRLRWMWSWDYNWNYRTSAVIAQSLTLIPGHLSSSWPTSWSSTSSTSYLSLSSYLSWYSTSSFCASPPPPSIFSSSSFLFSFSYFTHTNWFVVNISHFINRNTRSLCYLLQFSLPDWDRVKLDTVYHGTEKKMKKIKEKERKKERSKEGRWRKMKGFKTRKKRRWREDVRTRGT